ncbi:MAG: putative protein of unknown function cell surface [Pseudonocardiales bacterium]|nr:putative protein of unknown function cell surface [Pseudonocardiales bacterium]
MPRIITILVAVLFAGGIFSPANSHAAPAPATPTLTAPTTWSVQPSTATGPTTRNQYDLNLSPGAVAPDFVGIRNLGTTPLTLQVYASDAFTTAAGGFDLLPADRQSADAGSWVEFHPAGQAGGARITLTVAPRQRIDIPFTVTVPANASPGDHAAGIVASQSTPSTDAAGRSVLVDNRVGSRVYLRVDGTLHPSLVVSNFVAGYRNTWNPLGGGSVSVSYTVRNNGNVRLSAHAVAVVSGLGGTLSARHALADIPELLPGASYTATRSINGVFPALKIKTGLTVQGYSTSSGVSMPPAEAASSSWAMPWSVLLLVVLIAGLFVTLVMRRRSRPSRTVGRHGVG